MAIAPLCLAAVAAASVAYLLYYRTLAKRPTLYFQDNSKNRVILENCNTLFNPYYPTFWAANGHVSTLVGTIYRSLPNLEFEREKVELSDGGVVYLDWCRPPNKPKCNPIVLVLSGLNGCSDASYVRHLMQTIQQKHGWNCVALNNRGTGTTELRTPKSYCGAFTDDIRATVKQIIRNNPDAPLMMVGFSMGANLLVKYLGEEGGNSQVKAAVSICNPFDFHVSSSVLEKGIGKVYNRVLHKGCVQTVSKHADCFEKAEGVNMKKVLSTSSLREFDDEFTRKIFGFSSVEHYYDAASSRQYLHGIQTHLLCVSAVDDPITHKRTLPTQECKENPKTILAVTATGGHMGYCEGWNPCDGSNWTDRVATEFLSSCLNNTDN